MTLTAFVIQMPYQYHAKTIGVAPDILAFLKYSLVWLLPEIMAVLAVSFLITEFTENVESRHQAKQKYQQQMRGILPAKKPTSYA